MRGHPGVGGGGGVRRGSRKTIRGKEIWETWVALGRRRGRYWHLGAACRRRGQPGGDGCRAPGK